jgi:hypothetical protein
VDPNLIVTGKRRRTVVNYKVDLEEEDEDEEDDDDEE